MALEFPDTPTLNQTYSYGGKTYIWTGTFWSVYGDFPIGFTNVQGTYGGYIVNAAYTTNSQNIPNPIPIVWSSNSWVLPAVGVSLAIGF